MAESGRAPDGLSVCDWSAAAHGQLHMFELGEHGGLLIDRYWDDPPENARVDEQVRLSSLTAGQQFVYVFDLGDDWAHLCTVGD